MISVIIPTYNRAATILESVNSVLTQTYSDIELIIIDDGSTDNTEEIIKSIPDKRIVYLKQTQQGACIARNHGIDVAKGQYIAFNDSDDIWVSDKLEKQLECLKSSHADVVYCGMERHVGNKVHYFPADQKKGEKLTLEKLLSRNKVSTQTILMKREITDAIRFDSTYMRFQDWDFVLRILERGYKVEYLHEPLVVARVQNDSITMKVPPEKSYLYFMERHWDKYEKYPRQIGSVYELIASSTKSDYQKKIYYLYNSLKYRFSLRVLMKLKIS